MKHKATLVEIDVDGKKISAKDCSKCFVVKPLVEFNKRSNGLGGRDSRCRKCFNDLTKEKKSKYDSKYRELNKAKLNRRSIDWHYANREFANQSRRKHYEQNKEHHYQMCKKWAEENREKYLEIMRKSSARYRERNPEYVERCREASKRHYHFNKEAYAKRWAEYYGTEKGKIASKRASHRRRERMSLTEINFSEDEWLFVLEFFDNSCAYCGESDKTMTMDHFVPVAKLGSFTADNIIPCCSSCNSSKQDSDFFEWYRKQPFYSLESEQYVLGYIFDRKDERKIS